MTPKPKGIKKLLAKARKNVQKQIAINSQGTTDRQRFFASGLSGEGYAGGYRDALDDVFLALNGVTPDRNGWWRE